LGLVFLLPGVTRANDFPTQVRVEFVLGCMDEHGGQSYDTLYRCVCLVDAIAAEMTHDEFVEARVFSQLRTTPGERGGVFRDPDQARSLVAKLQAVTERGKAKCLIPK
jgi:aminopeptidase-like protein